MDQYPTCRHILTNGDQCQAPRLRTGSFCYFHARLRTQHQVTLKARRDLPITNTEGVVIGYGRPVGFQTDRLPDFGPLEDRASVQMAISTVVNALAMEALDTRRAATLLYGLQLASNNCIRQKSSHFTADDPVDQVEIDPDGTALAPADRIPAAVQHKSDLERELENFLNECDTEDLEEDDEEDWEDE